MLGVLLVVVLVVEDVLEVEEVVVDEVDVDVVPGSDEDVVGSELDVVLDSSIVVEVVDVVLVVVVVGTGSGGAATQPEEKAAIR